MYEYRIPMRYRQEFRNGPEKFWIEDDFDSRKLEQVYNDELLKYNCKYSKGVLIFKTEEDMTRFILEWL